MFLEHQTPILFLSPIVGQKVIYMIWSFLPRNISKLLTGKRASVLNVEVPCALEDILSCTSPCLSESNGHRYVASTYYTLGSLERIHWSRFLSSWGHHHFPPSRSMTCSVRSALFFCHHCLMQYSKLHKPVFVQFGFYIVFMCSTWEYWASYSAAVPKHVNHAKLHHRVLSLGCGNNLPNLSRCWVLS